ncbi:hypothetical protein [Pseudodesulfovibrio sp.]|uniref:hypothetical protein n=1 Tax=Pseudodesulfovibrio sp. TaxID=2035812 RepID=UPI002630120D|nr:hypothetical protein [Pseudodesulfovibrio sp.]MDD3312998.1 hypothetical protein [Pseudodesulfovibrio sp.]
MNKHKTPALLALWLALAVLLCAFPALAEDESEGIMNVKLAKAPEPLAKPVEQSIDSLFALLQDRQGALDEAAIEPMLDFVLNGPADPKDISPARRFGGQGICLRQDVSTDLDTILRYFYNPDIPNFLLCPAVLRLSGWREGCEFLTRPTKLWDDLKALDRPVLVRGKEFEVNTPDSFAEAYYKYDLDRLIILLKYKGRNVAISISEQKDQSDVGRKGAILDDSQWEYFYSGIEGLNKGLIGWMDTFMYQSASVQVFLERDAAAPRSTVFLFKWLNAGWMGSNVVKRSHIYDGSLRYARSFCKVLESASLTPEEMAAQIRPVLDMNNAQVNAKIQEYARNFEIRFKDSPKLKPRSYAKIVADGGYAEVLDDEARRSVLALQKLKSLVGMETLVDLATSPVAAAPARPAPAPAPAAPDAATVEAKPES